MNGCRVGKKLMRVVGVAASEMVDSEVLVIAPADISREDKQGGFAVKRGSYSVNEYPRLGKPIKKLPIDQTT